MTREAMLNEISQLPDEVLSAFINLIRASGLPSQTTAQKNVGDNIKKYRTAGSLEGKIIISDDFDEPLDDMKEYMY